MEGCLFVFDVDQIDNVIQVKVAQTKGSNSPILLPKRTLLVRWLNDKSNRLPAS
jgi:hypothetical protein